MFTALTKCPSRLSMFLSTSISPTSGRSLVGDIVRPLTAAPTGLAALGSDTSRLYTNLSVGNGLV